jgi:hypothetical protein
MPTAERNASVDRTFGVTPSSARHVALVTVNGTDGAAGTEVTGAGYARKTATFATASNGATSNTALLTWTATGGNYGTVVGVEVYTAATGGTRLYFAPLNASQSVTDTVTLEIAAGALTYSLNA